MGGGGNDVFRLTLLPEKRLRSLLRSLFQSKMPLRQPRMSLGSLLLGEEREPW